MKLVLLFGPQAVGKMTVGQELEKLTGLKLFHNHMTIELLQPFFGFGEDMWRLSQLFREEMFRTYAKSDQYGMIFTFIWAFNKQEDWDFVETIIDIFEGDGGVVYFVELQADMEERVKRNRTPNRLEHKPSKRDVEASEERMIASMDHLRMNTKDGEIKEKNYIKINNSELEPYVVAERIRETLGL
ncbi:AAA family ATPase [Halobacillus litoralis]|uniref:AAA family ATPase n=1 Tax=Halobacillus litoralis TaxID=45668 RepID=UPI001CFED51B|nr:AAA family ATPase [Halobacillus litoralis]WLR49533.1 AAA family ATPase [Halobacillus litoralis]